MKQLVADADSIKIMVDGETVEEFEPSKIYVPYDRLGPDTAQLDVAVEKGVAFWTLMLVGARSIPLINAERAGLTHAEIMHALSLYGGAK